MSGGRGEAERIDREGVVGVGGGWERWGRERLGGRGR